MMINNGFNSNTGSLINNNFSGMIGNKSILGNSNGTPHHSNIGSINSNSLFKSNSTARLHGGGPIK